MIRLFVTDIDGCLSIPYRAFRLDVLGRLREYAVAAGEPGTHELYPAVSICSGRAYPYVEAMSQLLDLRCPVLFESGAGLFDPVQMHCIWHPEFDADVQIEMEEVKTFVTSLTDGRRLSIDLSKRSQVAVVAPERSVIESVYEEIVGYVSSSHPALETFMTPFSIDIVAPHLTKREGIAWLAERCGLSWGEIAFVGDTSGDMGALAKAGRSYAPANADTPVKDLVDVTTAGSDVEGVLEAYHDAIEFNRQANRRGS